MLLTLYRTLGTLCPAFSVPVLPCSVCSVTSLETPSSMESALAGVPSSPSLAAVPFAMHQWRNITVDKVQLGLFFPTNFFLLTLMVITDSKDTWTVSSAFKEAHSWCFV